MGSDRLMDTPVKLTQDEHIALIELQLSELKTLIELIRKDIGEAKEVIDKVGEEVMPTINQLKDSPMLRMLTGGKKVK
jgi:hypothetical protein